MSDNENRGPDISRRKFGALSLSALVSGCLGGSGPDNVVEPDDTNGRTPNGTGTPTEGPTETPRPELEDQEFGNRGLPSRYDELEDTFDDLEEERLDDNVFLHGALDTSGSGSFYERGDGVLATDDVVLASRDQADHTISRELNEDDGTFKWYTGQVPRVETGFRSVSNLLRDEDISDLSDEKVGDFNSSPVYSTFESYLEEAVNELQLIAPFIRTDTFNNNPIISDDVIEDFEDRRSDLEDLKEDYGDLLFGRQGLQNLRQTVDPDEYSRNAVYDAQNLFDESLKRYGGLMLLEEVYSEVSDSLDVLQDEFDDGRFDEEAEDTHDDDDGDNGDEQNGEGGQKKDYVWEIDNKSAITYIADSEVRQNEDLYDFIGDALSRNENSGFFRNGYTFPDRNEHRIVRNGEDDIDSEAYEVLSAFFDGSPESPYGELSSLKFYGEANLEKNDYDIDEIEFEITRNKPGGGFVNPTLRQDTTMDVFEAYEGNRNLEMRER